MAIDQSGDKGPAAPQHRVSRCTHTAQGAPGTRVWLGEAGKAMSGVRDGLCQINLILFSYMAFLF